MTSLVDPKNILFLDCTSRERRHSRVVTASWLWSRKSPEGPEFEAGLRFSTTEKRISRWVHVRIRAAKAEGWAPLFI